MMKPSLFQSPFGEYVFQGFEAQMTTTNEVTPPKFGRVGSVWAWKKGTNRVWFSRWGTA